MVTRKIDRAEWAPFFDRFSHRLLREHRFDYAEIRIFADEVGAQPETGWVPLQGVVYDPHDDVLEIAVERLDHLIFHPDEIYVDEVDGVVARIAVMAADGGKEIIEVR